MLRTVIQAESGTQGVGGWALLRAEGVEWKESIHEPLVRVWGRKGTRNEGDVIPWSSLGHEHCRLWAC